MRREPEMRPCEKCSSLTRSHIMVDKTYYCHKCWTRLSKEEREALIEKTKRNVKLQEELVKALKGGTVRKRDSKGEPIVVPTPFEIEPEVDSKTKSSEETK